MKRLLFVLLLGLTLCARGVASDRPRIVVTTSLLATAIDDLDGGAFDVVELMPPGTCPGQFDLEPSQARFVRDAALVIRHEHQAFLDRLFEAAGAPPNRIVVQHGGFIIPMDYYHTCENLAATLSVRFPSETPVLRHNLDRLRVRMTELAARLQAGAGPLKGKPVVAALFQADFLRWLGMDVVFTLPPTDDPGPALIRRAVATGAQKRAVMIVGNVQNGERLPRRIADTLHVGCAMPGNFPPHASSGAQDELMQANLQALLAALPKS